jgi:hypothetical protein
MAEDDLLTFNDGFVLDRNTILVAAQQRRHARDDISVALMIKDGAWRRMPFDDAAVSVAALRTLRQGFYLGANGTVLVVGAGRPRTEPVGDVARYGEMLRIKNVAERIYAGGMNGQVYVRLQERWQPVGTGLIGTKGFDVEDIDGTGPDDLWAVGTMSDAWHWDGQSWRRSDVPTDRPIGGVRCVSSDRVYLCGDDGNLFVGNGLSWQFIGDPQIDDIFWAIERFGDDLFLSFDGGLMRYDGKALARVDFGPAGVKGVDAYRLNAGDGVLWSFGADTLLWYDGTTWHRVEEPSP